MRHFKVLLLFLLVYLLNLSCTSAPPAPLGTDFPDIGVPSQEVNSRFALSAPSNGNSFRVGDVLGLGLRNISETDIVVRPASDILIYQKTPTGWEPIKNEVQYTDRTQRMLAKGNRDLSLDALMLIPIVTTSEGPVSIRILVFGTPYRGDQALPERTVSFVDVVLRR